MEVTKNQVWLCDTKNDLWLQSSCCTALEVLLHTLPGLFTRHKEDEVELEANICYH